VHGTLAALQLQRASERMSASLQDKLLAGSGTHGLFDSELDRARARLAGRFNADREGLEKGLAQLVMTLIELLRQLMERQALHRIEGGTLGEEEIERLGMTFMALSDRMEQLKEAFGLSDEDLNLDLGPLGKLM
jgi:Gas vesicle protein K